MRRAGKNFEIDKIALTKFSGYSYAVLDFFRGVLHSYGRLDKSVVLAAPAYSFQMPD